MGACPATLSRDFFWGNGGRWKPNKPSPPDLISLRSLRYWLNPSNVQGAILDRTWVINILDAHSDALWAAVVGGENVFDVYNFESPNSIISNGGAILSVPVAHCLARQKRGKVDRVSRKGEVFVLWYHKVNIAQGWINVKRNYTKAIKKVKSGGMASITAVPQKLNTSICLSSKIALTHIISVPPITKGRITDNNEGMI